MVVHKDCSKTVKFPLERLSVLLAELVVEVDIEKYVALTHDSESCLSVSPNNTVI